MIEAPCWSDSVPLSRTTDAVLPRCCHLQFIFVDDRTFQDFRRWNNDAFASFLTEIFTVRRKKHNARQPHDGWRWMRETLGRNLARQDAPVDVAHGFGAIMNLQLFVDMLDMVTGGDITDM